MIGKKSTLIMSNTEELEAELRSISDQLETGKLLFQQVSEELARRHAAGGDQPAPETADQRAEKRREAECNLDKNLILKIIAMEAEQAKLVVEAEVYKSQRDEANGRLQLLAKSGDFVPKPAVEDLRVVINESCAVTEVNDATPWTLRLYAAARAVAEVSLVVLLFAACAESSPPPADAPADIPATTGSNNNMTPALVPLADAPDCPTAGVVPPCVVEVVSHAEPAQVGVRLCCPQPGQVILFLAVDSSAGPWGDVTEWAFCGWPYVFEVTNPRRSGTLPWAVASTNDGDGGVVTSCKSTTAP
jgi:hypothetical protein